MKVRGIDFTSSPSGRKPLTCFEGWFGDGMLTLVRLERWPGFGPFEAALCSPGPWIAGLDFPFGFSRRFVENVGWPLSWGGYVDHIGSLTRPAFSACLEAYKRDRPKGDKEHRRPTDAKASSVSPQKLHGVPVAKMLHEGSPRLRRAGVTIPGMQQGDPERIVVETYPGVLARRLIGRTSYKQDNPRKQSPAQLQARRNLVRAVASDRFRAIYGVTVNAPGWLADDPTGDELDAMLCAVQAAWCWTRRTEGFGAPADLDPLEGWIADPAAGERPAPVSS